jgi:sporulation protein YlmC with PRC-barrel domain
MKPMIALGTVLLAGNITGSHLPLAYAQTPPTQPPAPNATAVPRSSAAFETGTASTAVAPNSTPPAAPSPAQPTWRLSIVSLSGMNILTADGKEIGSGAIVENNADARQFLVVRYGGFLGFGAKEIAVPLEDIVVQNDRIVLRDVNEAQIAGMPEFHNDGNAFRELDKEQRVTVKVQ